MTATPASLRLTVALWAMFQLLRSNVIAAGLNSTSPESRLARVTVTACVCG